MMKNVRDNLLLCAQLIALVCCVAVLKHTDQIHQQSSYAPVADTAPVFDEEKLSQLIHKEIAALPKPIDGKDGASGTNGQNGSNGQNASVDYDKVRSIVQDEVAKIPTPKDGNNGADGIGSPGREIELQTNILNGNLEWRYIGDDSWQLLMKRCAMLGNCDGTQ